MCGLDLDRRWAVSGGGAADGRARGGAPRRRERGSFSRVRPAVGQLAVRGTLGVSCSRDGCAVPEEAAILLHLHFVRGRCGAAPCFCNRPQPVWHRRAAEQRGSVGSRRPTRWVGISLPYLPLLRALLLCGQRPRSARCAAACRCMCLLRRGGAGGRPAAGGCFRFGASSSLRFVFPSDAAHHTERAVCSQCRNWSSRSISRTRAPAAGGVGGGRLGEDRQPGASAPSCGVGGGPQDSVPAAALQTTFSHAKHIRDNVLRLFFCRSLVPRCRPEDFQRPVSRHCRPLPRCHQDDGHRPGWGQGVCPSLSGCTRSTPQFP